MQMPQDHSHLYQSAPYVRLGWLIVAVFVSLFVVWGVFAPMHSAAVATGKIVVEGQTKNVQHLEGGIVETILVENGDSVQAGQALLKMQETQTKSELQIVNMQFHEALAKQARLEAERDQLKQIVFRNERWALSRFDMKRLTDLQTQLFNERRNTLYSEDEILQQKIKRLNEQRLGLEKERQFQQQMVRSVEAELAEYQELYQQKLTNKLKVQENERRLIELRAELANQATQIASLKVQVSEAEEQRILSQRQFRQEVLSELEQTEQRLNDLRARRVALQDKMNRVTVVSPVDGVVEALQVYTEGGVIAPGETVMTIVPTERKSIIEAELNLTDIDKVYPGLMADIRFSAYASQNVHVVEAQVDYVSSDRTVKPNTDKEFYVVRLSLTDDGKAMAKKNGFEIKTGMPVEVMIKTGERTLLSYLVQPFTNMMSRALNED